MKLHIQIVDLLQNQNIITHQYVIRSARRVTVLGFLNSTDASIDSLITLMIRLLLALSLAYLMSINILPHHSLGIWGHILP
jgi:hypothetical protein